MNELSGFWNDENTKTLIDKLKSMNFDLSNWDVSSVFNFSGMFYGCREYNNNSKPLNWKTESAINLSFLFAGCSKFNQPPR